MLDEKFKKRKNWHILVYGYLVDTSNDFVQKYKLSVEWPMKLSILKLNLITLKNNNSSVKKENEWIVIKTSIKFNDCK